MAATAQGASLEDVVTSELARAVETFEQQPEKPHYIAVAIEERQEVEIAARDGTLAHRSHTEERLLDVDMRVGSPALDSTHELRGFSAMEGDDRNQVTLPMAPAPGSGGGQSVDDATEYALRHALWLELDQRYREQAERIVMVRANQSVKVEEEDPAPDFEARQTPVIDRRAVPPLQIDEPAWEALLVDVSKRLELDPDVHFASVGLQAVHQVKTFVDTEGTRLVHGRNALRVSLQVQTTAEDGDVVSVFRAVDVHDPATLPSAEELLGWADASVARVKALREAPRGSAYSGPVILTGRASGVFFHEVFGHRVEGHRQKRESEGKTFADHVGDSILPDFIDVYDDPTITAMAGSDLNGFYAYDDEGVAAQRASLVEDGRFVGFLMARSPIAGFERSNGHGRRMAGMAPVARMGNTIVQAAQTVPRERLRAMLIDEAKEQGLTYGILVDEIEGGFTITGRVEPNAFNVRASRSWRVYTDGRPDELVRGIDLVGTPLVAFKNVVAAGDDYEVFDGYCGAESGWVPVSAVAPSLLFRSLEFQLKEKGQERPPLLPKPEIADDGAADAP
jgi:predicted Zn-dependent protease